MRSDPSPNDDVSQLPSAPPSDEEREYTVRWEIDVPALSYEDAVDFAAQILREQLFRTEHSDAGPPIFQVRLMPAPWREVTLP